MTFGIRRNFVCCKLKKKVYKKVQLWFIFEKKPQPYTWEKIMLKFIYISAEVIKKNIIVREMHRFAFEDIIFSDEIY